MKPQLPHIKINVPMVVTSNDVYEIFTAVCRHNDFQIIEMDQNIATAVNKEPFSFKKILQRCIPFSDKSKESESIISALRLQISINDVKCCRKVSLKGLYGDHSKLQGFVGTFKNKLHGFVQTIPQEKREVESERKKNTKLRELKRSVKSYNESDDDDSDRENKNYGYNETSSIYVIHKILSSDQYTLGKNVAEYIECFHLQYKSIRESAMLLP